MKLFNSKKQFGSIRLFPGMVSAKNPVKGLVLILILSYIVSLVIIVISTQMDFPFSQTKADLFRLNEYAVEDFFVTRDFQYTDAEATQARKQAVMKTVLPVFRLNTDISKNCLAQFAAFASILQKGVEDRVSINPLITQLQIQIPKFYQTVQKADIEKIAAIVSRQTDILSQIKSNLDEAERVGIFQGLDDLFASTPDYFTQGNIEQYLSESRVIVIPMEKAISLKTIDGWLEKRMRDNAFPEALRPIAMKFTRAFIQENCFFDRKQTEENRKAVADSIPPIKKSLQRNQAIVHKGDMVTEEILTQIKALDESDFSVNVYSVLGNAIFLAIIYTLGFFLFSRSFNNIRLSKSQVYLLISFALVFLFLCAILYRIPFDLQKSGIPFTILVPTGLFCILLSNLISLNTGFTFAFTSSLLVLLISRMDISAMLFSFLSGVFATYVSLKTEDRFDLIVGGLFLALCNSIVIIAIIFVMNLSTDLIFPAVFVCALNGFASGLSSLSFLPLLETLLNSATRFRLMELSDLNAAIFKRMLTLAPGTYNHSIMVANLAESASTEIKANYLLARAGAYYHDIGKIDQAEYFIENQRTNNKHDDLRPSLSVAVIKSHVKIGIEKAKELKLPKEIIDIIEQHHGKGLIAYFYHRAQAEDQKAIPEDFSYPGERPRTKEAAVVMLADIVEASSRSLKRPTLGKLEKLVWSVIMDRFNAGELSKCPLTLSDLEIIKRSFVQILSGYFHTRIEYPKAKEPKEKEKEAVNERK